MKPITIICIVMAAIIFFLPSEYKWIPLVPLAGLVGFDIGRSDISQRKPKYRNLIIGFAIYAAGMIYKVLF
jgi:hypothetical protein